MLGCEKTSEPMSRWNVDRQTARSAVSRAAIAPQTVHNSPHHLWSDVLKKVEGWPADFIGEIDLSAPLHGTSDLANLLSVSFPTVRNYGKSGLLHEVRLGRKTLRYAFPSNLSAEVSEKVRGGAKVGK